MKLNEVLSVLENKVAPVSLSDEFCKKFGTYDNSGIILRCAEEINGVLFSLDFSQKSVREAKRLGFNLIVTHHPAIFGGILRLDTASDPQAAAISECIRCGISVISMHLNFDVAPEGIDYHLMCGLGGSNAEVHMCVPGGGYGRAYDVNPVDFDDYVKMVKNKFGTDKIVAYNALSGRKITRVASFCGAGCDGNAIEFAAMNGATAFVSSDMKHHEITALLERGISVIHITHFASENYGFNKIYLKLKEVLDIPSEYFSDDCLL